MSSTLVSANRPDAVAALAKIMSIATDPIVALSQAAAGISPGRLAAGCLVPLALVVVLPGFDAFSGGEHGDHQRRGRVSQPPASQVFRPTPSRAAAAMNAQKALSAASAMGARLPRAGRCGASRSAATA